MKITRLALLAATAITTAAGLSAAAAQDATGPWSVSANVALTNDYRFRGVSLSDESFAIQGGLDASHESGFYVGTWASSLSGDGIPTELDAYAGYGFGTDAISFDVGVIGYFYPGARTSAGDDLDYVEFYGSASTDVGTGSLTVGLAYAPEQDGTGETDNTYVYGSYSVPLSDALTFDALIGYEDGAFAAEKVDWSLGIGTSLGALDVSLAYVGYDSDAGDDNTVVISVGKTF